MKLLIAINNNNGIYSVLSDHFGHCPYYAIYDTETSSLEIAKNDVNHSNTALTPVDQVINQFNPEVIFSLSIGQKALKLFNDKGIKIKTGKFRTVKEVINNVNELNDLDTTCNH